MKDGEGNLVKDATITWDYDENSVITSKAETQTDSVGEARIYWIEPGVFYQDKIGGTTYDTTGANIMHAYLKVVDNYDNPVSGQKVTYHITKEVGNDTSDELPRRMLIQMRMD